MGHPRFYLCLHSVCVKAREDALRQQHLDWTTKLAETEAAHATALSDLKLVMDTVCMLAFG
jgi:hypothetical protein